MLIIQDFYTKEPIEFGNSSALKEFLKFQNPTAMRFYREAVEKQLPLKIYGLGEEIKIEPVNLSRSNK